MRDPENLSRPCYAGLIPAALNISAINRVSSRIALASCSGVSAMRSQPRATICRAAKSGNRAIVVDALAHSSTPLQVGGRPLRPEGFIHRPV